MLSEYDIVYVSQKAIKGNVITEFLANKVADDYEPMKLDFWLAIARFFLWILTAIFLWFPPIYLLIYPMPEYSLLAIILDPSAMPLQYQPPSTIATLTILH